MTSTLVKMIAALALVGVTIQAQARQPIQREVLTTYVDYAGIADATLTERIAKVDAVAHVRVIGEGKPRLTFPAVGQGTPGVVTDYSLQVLEVMKAHPFIGAIGANVTVSQPGGEADWGEKYRVVTRAEPHVFEPGKRYLVFLTANKTTRALMVGAADVFLVDAERADGNGLSRRTPYASQLVGRPVAEALARIRAAADSAR